MKSLTEHLWFEVPGRRGFINITPTVEELVGQSGVTEGLCLVNAMHITASVFINDDEAGLHHDYEMWLEKLAPHAPTSAYRHKPKSQRFKARPARSRKHSELLRSRYGSFQLSSFSSVRPPRILRPPPQTRAGEIHRRVSPPVQNPSPPHFARCGASRVSPFAPAILPSALESPTHLRTPRCVF